MYFQVDPCKTYQRQQPFDNTMNNLGNLRIKLSSHNQTLPKFINHSFDVKQQTKQFTPPQQQVELKFLNFTSEQIKHLHSTNEIIKLMHVNVTTDQLHLVLQQVFSYWRSFDLNGDIAETTLNMGLPKYYLDLSFLYLVEKLCFLLVFDRLHERDYTDLFSLVCEARSHYNMLMCHQSTDPQLNYKKIFIMGKLMDKDKCQTTFHATIKQIRFKIVTMSQQIEPNSTNSLDQFVITLNKQSTYGDSLLHLRQNFSLWLYQQEDLNILHQMPQCLRCPPTPYLPDIDPRTLILVVDLDETLVHYKRKPQEKNQLYVRTHAKWFLETLSLHYQIVVWTASLPRYAKWALKRIGANIKIQLLTRQHCTMNENPIFVKQLKCLCPDSINRSILIENEIRSSCEQERDNCIIVKPYFGDEDQELQQLCFLLIKVAELWNPSISIASSLALK